MILELRDILPISSSYSKIPVDLECAACTFLEENYNVIATLEEYNVDKMVELVLKEGDFPSDYCLQKDPGLLELNILNSKCCS